MRSRTREPGPNSAPGPTVLVIDHIHFLSASPRRPGIYRGLVRPSGGIGGKRFRGAVRFLDKLFESPILDSSGFLHVPSGTQQSTHSVAFCDLPCTEKQQLSGERNAACSRVMLHFVLDKPNRWV